MPHRTCAGARRAINLIPTSTGAPPRDRARAAELKGKVDGSRARPVPTGSVTDWSSGRRETTAEEVNEGSATPPHPARSRTTIQYSRGSRSSDRPSSTRRTRGIFDSQLTMVNGNSGQGSSAGTTTSGAYSCRLGRSDRQAALSRSCRARFARRRRGKACSSRRPERPLEERPGRRRHAHPSCAADPRVCSTWGGQVRVCSHLGAEAARTRVLDRAGARRTCAGSSPTSASSVLENTRFTRRDEERPEFARELRGCDLSSTTPSAPAPRARLDRGVAHCCRLTRPAHCSRSSSTSAAARRRRAAVRARHRRREGRGQARRAENLGGARTRCSSAARWPRSCGTRTRSVRGRAADDVVAASAFEPTRRRGAPFDALPDGLARARHRPETRERVRRRIARRETVFWNGPMGVFEWERSRRDEGGRAGRRGVRRLHGRRRRRLGRGGQRARLATGSRGSRPAAAASLELLEGKVLPGVAAIPENSADADRRQLEDVQGAGARRAPSSTSSSRRTASTSFSARLSSRSPRRSRAAHRLGAERPLGGAGAPTPARSRRRCCSKLGVKGALRRPLGAAASCSARATRPFARRGAHRARRAGLGVIACVGETPEQRDSGVTELVLKIQVRGDRRFAAPGRARAARDRLRAGLGDRHGQDRDAGAGAGGARVHQGAARRAGALRRLGQAGERGRAARAADVDGALVGGASLDPTRSQRFAAPRRPS
jgi:hypothetical protein